LSLLLLTAVVLAGCNLNTPVAPNTDGQLTGQTTNQQFVFTGTISISAGGFTLTADDTATVTITANVRDASGNPVPNLTTIVFSTNLGAFVTEAGLTTVATATTFNGIAQVFFSSSNRQAGTATITASLGTVASSVNVTLEAEPVTGTLSASFGTTGTGATSSTGMIPPGTHGQLDVDISAEALDLAGVAIVGATVRFRIVTDTTDELTTNEPVEFVGSSTTTTNSSGIAGALIRVRGPGDVVIDADLIDPVTGQTVATSNEIILVTTASTTIPTLVLNFDDDSTTIELGGTVAPVSVGVEATATNAAGNPVPNATVRFVIRSDSAGTAFFGGQAPGASQTVQTSSAGVAFTSITLTAPTQNVLIGAEWLDAAGNVIATATNIRAVYD
jgi:hypothetical protein